MLQFLGQLEYFERHWFIFLVVSLLRFFIIQQHSSLPALLPASSALSDFVVNLLNTIILIDDCAF
jgi:hypothetical protein